MVHKNDSSHRFCVERSHESRHVPPATYRWFVRPAGPLSVLLNPWPRVWLLADLCESHITREGVVPIQGIGLTNAPAVFQPRLVTGLNPPDFVAVYIDDVLVFWRSTSTTWKLLSSEWVRLDSNSNPLSAVSSVRRWSTRVWSPNYSVPTTYGPQQWSPLHRTCVLLSSVHQGETDHSPCSLHFTVASEQRQDDGKLHPVAYARTQQSSRFWPLYGPSMDSLWPWWLTTLQF